MSTEASIMEKLEGPFPVLPTVFKDDFSLDLDGLGNIIDRLLDKGIRGMTLLGSGAETPFLDADERRSLLEFAVRRIDGRATVISGVIQWGTRQAIAEAKRCRDAGADAFLWAVDVLQEGIEGFRAAALLLQLFSLHIVRIVDLGGQERVLAITAAGAEERHHERPARENLAADGHQAGKGIEQVFVRSKFRTSSRRLKL